MLDDMIISDSSVGCKMSAIALYLGTLEKENNVVHNNHVGELHTIAGDRNWKMCC